MAIKDWILTVARLLAVKVIVYEHCHVVRNSTTSIAGILKHCELAGKINKNQLHAIHYELSEIEKSLTYVRQLNKGA